MPFSVALQESMNENFMMAYARVCVCVCVCVRALIAAYGDVNKTLMINILENNLVVSVGHNQRINEVMASFLECL